MVERYRRHGPLDHLGLAAQPAPADGAPAPGVTLAERPFLDMINLRGDAADGAFLDAVEKAIKLRPPVAANAVAGKAADTHVFWLGPNEWLVVCRPGGGERAAKALRTALAGLHAAVTEVGEARTCFRLSGKMARSVLAKGCALDLHPSVFGPGQCAQTLLARMGVVLHMTAEARGGAPSYDIIVLRSFASHLWAWLEDAAQEYGLAIDA